MNKPTWVDHLKSFGVIFVITIGVSSMFKLIPNWILWTLAGLTVAVVCWALWEVGRSVLIAKRSNDEDRDSLVAGYRRTKP